MKYYVKIYDENGKRTAIYDKYHRELSIKVDENGVLRIPERTFSENGYSFQVETNADIVDCSYSQICKLIANKATYIECNGCKITYLEAQKVKKIECNNNPLDFLSVPKAEEVECKNCPLTEINAPKVEKLVCSDCIFDNTEITDIDYPNLENLEIINTNIQTIKHSKLKYLDAVNNSIKKLELPNAESIYIHSEKNLNELDVLKAQKITCISTLIETIIADNTEKIFLKDNHFLKRIFAKNLKELSIYGSDYVEDMVIPKETEIKGVSQTMETIYELRR